MVEKLHEKRARTDAETEDVQHQLTKRGALQIVWILIGEHWTTVVQIERMPVGQAGGVGESVDEADQIEGSERFRIEPVVEIQNGLLKWLVGDRSILDLLLVQVAGQKFLAQIR